MNKKKQKSLTKSKKSIYQEENFLVAASTRVESV